MAPRSVSFMDAPLLSTSSSSTHYHNHSNSNNNHQNQQQQQHRQQRRQFINSLRVSTSNTITTMSPSSPSSPGMYYETESPDVMMTTSGAPLIDRLAFVLVDDITNHTNNNNSHHHHAHSSSSSRLVLQQIWWPAWIFESASEMFHELSSLTSQHRASLMQEFFQVGRQHHPPTQVQQHVAYLLGPASILPTCRRTMYGSPTRDFWTISDEVVTNCSEYPGWCDACLAAPELSNCNLEGGGNNYCNQATNMATSPTHYTNTATTSILSSPSHRTSTSPLRGSGGGIANSRSYVSPSSSPVRGRGRSYEYEEEEEEECASPRRANATSMSTSRAVKYRRRRNFN